MRRTTLQASSLLWVACSLGLVGCGPEGTARFEATITDGGCYQDQFPFEPDFFALVATPTGALIRMEEHVRERTRTDGFYLLIDPGRSGKPGLDGQPLSCPKLDAISGTTQRIEPEGCIQAYFRFNYSCPRDFLNAQLRGDVTFDNFTMEVGGEVRGSLSGELVELRTSPGYEADRLEIVPRGQTSGTFAFEIDESPNRQIYYWPPEHIDQP